MGRIIDTRWTPPTGPGDAARPVSNTVHALAIVITVGVLAVGALIGGLWLLAQGCAWFGHALPAPGFLKA